MRTPSSLVVVAFIGLAAGACSRPKPAASHLDLVLGENARPAPVASALEIWGKAKATPAAPTTHSSAVAPLHAQRRARTHRPALHPRRAPGAERVPVIAREPQPSVAVAPAAPTPVIHASAPAPAPDPAPAEPTAQSGHGWGGWSEPNDGGGRMPGIPGGVIIIRGGHSGNDPCDEHGRGGIGGGIFPGLPGRIGGGRPGGIVFLRGR